MSNNDLRTSLISRGQLLKWLHDDGSSRLDVIVDDVARCLRAGGTIFACGNGGSASQAEHFAAELVGRFKLERKALAAVALSTNSATITAIANDYGFAEVFGRQIDGIGKRGDCLLALSTSGTSPNVVKACQVAKRKQMRVFSLTGQGGGEVASTSDLTIAVPHTDTAKIQEVHLVALHLICQLVEAKMFSPEPNKEKV